jgi:hypothetical protein
MVVGMIGKHVIWLQMGGTSYQEIDAQLECNAHPIWTETS